MKEIIDTLEKERTEYKERAKKIAAKLQDDAMISDCGSLGKEQD